jgi:nicotinate-nucleotide adenylyltransferase
MKTGLFFGSFNPIHIGHLIIAGYFTQFSDIKQVWFVVSPHNPLKNKETLAADHHRLNMVKLAIDDNPTLRASDIEFGLSQPSYTVNTLAYLREKYPRKEFVLIMGGDNLETFHKWKNYQDILHYHSIYVYNRPDSNTSTFATHPKVKLFDAPLMKISSSFIRQAITEKRDIKYLVNDKVAAYIEDMMLYGGK